MSAERQRRAVVRHELLIGTHFGEDPHELGDRRFSATRCADDFHDAGRNDDLPDVVEVRSEGIRDEAFSLGRHVRHGRRDEKSIVYLEEVLVFVLLQRREVSALDDTAGATWSTLLID